MKTKLFSLLLALTMGVGTIAASDIKINDIWYDLDEVSQTAVVTYKGDAPDWDNRYTGRVVIPAKVKYNNVTYDVIAVGNYAFRQCRQLSEVVLPNSITSIGEYAFGGCYALSKFSIPASVTYIGKNAFYDCSSLLNLEIPSTVTTIESNAFNYVANIVYSGTDTNAPWGARAMNGFVDGYVVYKDNTKAELLACSHLAKGKLDLPSTLTTIDRYAFQYCIYLDSLRLPNSVKTIGEGAFYLCTTLISLVVPKTVTSIGNTAFRLVPNVIYNGSLTSTSNWGAKSLNGFVDGDLVYSDDTQTTLLAVSSNIKGQLNVPNSVKIIDRYAFSSMFAGITFPMLGNSVQSIGMYAFNSCANLTTVILPATVNNIEKYAFQSCENIKTFISEATTPPTCSDVIFSVDGDGHLRHRIYVPAGSLSAYKTATVWSTYKDSIFPITAEVIKVSDSKIIVDPVTDISATIKWPKRDEAVTYTVKIELEEVAKLTYVFDNEGQLATTAFGAPRKDGDTRGVVTTARAIADGWVYVFEGLEPNSNYKAIVKAEDAASVELYEYSTTFKTLKRQAIDQVSSDKVQCTKELRDGQLLIRRGDKTYTVSGQVIE